MADRGKLGELNETRSGCCLLIRLWSKIAHDTRKAVEVERVERFAIAKTSSRCQLELVEDHLIAIENAGPHYSLAWTGSQYPTFIDC
ncbi:hypothetical protein DACRYDRAFT_23066 [Dacryopinax primogenitus]|uniref:Uncharacterized protein n=1 Tax=Dacryopinax primogenitus (strain DJM 731) TaxID=1858805 RepID=M5GA19_DACPD|nr:uncharacterized protein DACRYDRAFT_23057 [Dacryopinax primogenitus]XP_040627580.1 uncharacterized protein DACRYDRAFT_23066 [Dacryopinax primogenitus]EJU00672.1 hypothetical protein DACRYDRAFT_23057 [Dacryopinax primogenitus]EJU00683.1 hypothetical protein DACRYDRAFT_23066 [Dacryopinax primogenitus]